MSFRLYANAALEDSVAKGHQDHTGHDTVNIMH